MKYLDVSTCTRCGKSCAREDAESLFYVHDNGRIKAVVQPCRDCKSELNREKANSKPCRRVHDRPQPSTHYKLVHGWKISGKEMQRYKACNPMVWYPQSLTSLFRGTFLALCDKPQPSTHYKLVHGWKISGKEIGEYRKLNPVVNLPRPTKKQYERMTYLRHRERYIAKAKARTAARTPEEHRYWSNRRRVKKKNAPGSHTQREWERLVAKYGGKCLCCGSTENITRDHVVPLSLGGSDDISNLQPLCHACNSAKQAQTIDYRSDSPTGRQ